MKKINIILILVILFESVMLGTVLIKNHSEVKTSEISTEGLIEIAKIVCKAKYPQLSSEIENNAWSTFTGHKGEILVFCMPEEVSVGGGLPEVRFNKNLGIKHITLGL